MVFLCGAANSPRRNRLAEYIRKHHKDKLVFYADDVWAQIAKKNTANALLMENELAQLADVVIIIVESPGTFAELGAFSLSEELRKKLLPIIDKKYEREESFINTGPVRWVNEDSLFKPALFIDFSIILSGAYELDKRLKQLPESGREIGEIVDNNKLSPRHLLFLLCDLLAVIGPASESHCEFYLNQILEGDSQWSISYLLGLGVAIGIIKVMLNSDGEPLYIRPLEQGALEPYLHKRSFNLATERARFLEVLHTIRASQQLFIRSHTS